MAEILKESYHIEADWRIILKLMSEALDGGVYWIRVAQDTQLRWRAVVNTVWASVFHVLEWLSKCFLEPWAQQSKWVSPQFPLLTIVLERVRKAEFRNLKGCLPLLNCYNWGSCSRTIRKSNRQFISWNKIYKHRTPVIAQMLETLLPIQNVNKEHSRTDWETVSSFVFCFVLTFSFLFGRDFG
jgi:hypothetical protein